MVLDVEQSHARKRSTTCGITRGIRYAKNTAMCVCECVCVCVCVCECVCVCLCVSVWIAELSCHSGYYT